MSGEISKKESHFSYLNKEGFVETIDIETGEKLGKKKFKPLNGYKYSEDFAFIVCQMIREGMSLKAICRQPGFPSYGTVYYWKKNNQEFKNMLAEAKKDRADAHMDNVIEISQRAMDGQFVKDDVAGMRLAMDGFEKAAAAGNPGEFGKARDQNVRVENLIIIDTGISRPVISSEEKEVNEIVKSDK